jgi:hypothetical protein
MFSDFKLDSDSGSLADGTKSKTTGDLLSQGNTTEQNLKSTQTTLSKFLENDEIANTPPTKVDNQEKNFYGNDVITTVDFLSPESVQYSFREVGNVTLYKIKSSDGYVFMDPKDYWEANKVLTEQINKNISDSQKKVNYDYELSDYDTTPKMSTRDRLNAGIALFSFIPQMGLISIGTSVMQSDFKGGVLGSIGLVKNKIVSLGAWAVGLKSSINK